MGIKESVRSYLGVNNTPTTSEIKNTKNKEIRMFNISNDLGNTNKLPHIPWFFNAQLGIPRNVNILELRQYAKSAWVQMVCNAICKQLMTTEWKIVLEDEEEDIELYEEQIEKIKTFLEFPNRNNDTFWDVWGAWLRDVLELDAGVIYKARNVKGELVELFNYDASRFLIKLDAEGHGLIQGYFQYSFTNFSSQPLFFEKEEIIYGRVNRIPEFFPYGFSPLQSIQQEVEVMIQSTRYNKEFFKNNAMPDGLVAVDMDEDNLNRFKSYWEQQVMGKPHKLMFHNAKEMSFVNLKTSNRDMEWLDGQKWFFHVVFGAYGLSPAEVGFYDDVNRACYSEDTEVLTDNGWKLFKQVENNDLIAVFDKDKDELIYEKPLNKFEYNVDEELINIKNERNDILVTKNHKILYKERRSNEWLVDEANSLKYDRMKLKKSPLNWKGIEIEKFILPKIERNKYQNYKTLQSDKDLEYNMDDWLEFLGYFLSEGGLSSTSTGYLITFAQKDEIVSAKIENCFRRLNLNYGKYFNKKDKTNRWNVYGRQIWTWLKENCGEYCHNKILPKFIKNLSKRQIEIFFEALMEGDGCWSEEYGWRKISLTSKELIDGVSDLSLKLGYSISFYQSPPRTENHHTLYSLNLCKKDFAQIKKEDIELIDYKGKVWCFETSTGFFVTRRNGKVAIQGNSQEGQERTTIKNAIKPYLKLIEDKINREILPEFDSEGLFCFKWFLHDSEQEKTKHEQMMSKLAANVYTINEVRAIEGKNPVEWGDKPFSMAMQDRFIANGGSKITEGRTEEYGNKNKEEPKDNKKEEQNQEQKYFSKEVDFIDIEESEEYADFLKKNFRIIEKKIDSFIEHSLKDELMEKNYEYINKSLGDFLQRLFNIVNTTAFMKGLKQVVKFNLNKGLNEAEKELNVDIGFTQLFEDKLDFLVHKQLYGFNVGDGEWNGIKGVSQDLQKEIARIVRQGMVDKIGYKGVSKQIKDLMTRNIGGEVDGQVTEGRAMRIARTETNRWRAESKLDAYRQSGLQGKKMWIATEMEKMCERCGKLNGQTIDLNKQFIDLETKIFSPPLHSNCMCSLQFVQD